MNFQYITKSAGTVFLNSFSQKRKPHLYLKNSRADPKPQKWARARGGWRTEKFFGAGFRIQREGPGGPHEKKEGLKHGPSARFFRGLSAREAGIESPQVKILRALPAFQRR